MPDAPHIMVVEARFYDDVADALMKGALAALEKGGATWERFQVMGSFELPAAVAIAIRSHEFFTARKRFDGYVALGCVIRGETSHYDIVCNESARALQDLACRYALALGYGILTCENHEQAMERARVDRRDRGGHAARACLAMVDHKRQFGLFPR